MSGERFGMGLSEAALQDAVAGLARVYHWRVAHFRAGVTERGHRTPVAYDGAGFPDLILVRGAHVLAVELKREARHAPVLTGEQAAWADAFAATPVAHYVWTPRELQSGTIVAVLKDGPPPRCPAEGVVS